MSRRILVAILCVLAFVPVVSADAALTFFWRCGDPSGSTTLDGTDDYSAGDNTATASGSPALTAAAGIGGTYGCDISTTAEFYQFTPASIIATSAGSVGFWFNLTTWSGAGQYFQVRGVTFNNNFRLLGAATDEMNFQVRDATAGLADTVQTTGVNFTNGTLYFITFSWDTNIRRLRVYNNSLTLIEEVVDTDAYTQPAEFGETNGLRFGEIGSGAAAFILDNIFVGSTYADADTFLCNASITSYTQYAACSSGTARKRMLLGVGQ